MMFRRANDSNVDTPGRAKDRSPVPAADITSTSIATVQKVLSKATKAMREQADSLPEKAQEASQQLVAAAKEKQRELVERVDAVGASGLISDIAHEAERHVGSRARNIQAVRVCVLTSMHASYRHDRSLLQTVSNAWIISGVTLFAEMLFVAAASIPLATRSLGPIEWITRPWTPNSPVTVVSALATAHAPVIDVVDRPCRTLLF